MLGQRADRLWLIGGALAVIALVALSYFVGVQPKYAEADTLRKQTSDAEKRRVKAQETLRLLEIENKSLPQHKAELASRREALPTATEMPAFLRELRNSAAPPRNISVIGVTVGETDEADTVNGKVYLVPVTLVVEGTPVDVKWWIDQIQRVQPRAVLVTRNNVTALESGGNLDARIRSQLDTTIFVAAPSTN